VARFSTKNSKPAQMEELWQESATAWEVAIGWNPPEKNNVDIMRYDIIGGPNERLLRWCQFACRLMDATEDADKLFGYAVKEGAEEDVAIGDDALGDIYGEECMYMPVAAPKQKCSLSRLLPGQDYYFIVRAVASSGKGEFSKVLGPCTTEKESPQKAQALELHDIELYTCSTRLRLPFNYGSPITEVHTVLRRLDGPLALEEMDEEGLVWDPKWMRGVVKTKPTRGFLWRGRPAAGARLFEPPALPHQEADKKGN
ncbi:unnamed protein product, partial [Effrenium voratum]